MKLYKLALATAGLVAATSSFAGLQICGTNNPQIDVKCGPDASSMKDTHIPIPQNGCTANLPWALVQAIALGGKSSGVCEFNEHDTGTLLGNASVSVTAASGTINSVTNINKDYSINYPTGTQSDIKVQITKNS